MPEESRSEPILEVKTRMPAAPSGLTLLKIIAFPIN